MLKGPTGSGKTRFVALTAARLGAPLITIACDADLTAADLTGRYLLRGGDTVWVDGPLTRAVRDGGICYLDEAVEKCRPATAAPIAKQDQDMAPTFLNCAGAIWWCFAVALLLLSLCCGLAQPFVQKRRATAIGQPPVSAILPITQRSIS